MKRLLSLCISAALVFGINIACGKSSKTALELTAYNHTSEGISWYSVSTSEGSDGGAGYLGAGAGGGGFTCCVSVPSKWRPGLTVSVTRATIIDGIEKKVVQTVPVPKYDSETASTLNIHFLRDGGTKVFVTRVMLGHRDYPLKGREAELKPGIPIEIRWP
jgi:uncharacterized membrane protein